MAKRFIDTELFNDSWFMDLSKDAKLGFIYCFCNCDHAGLLRLNVKLFEFQTGCKWIRVVEDLGNCLVSLNEQLYFMPKFIKFQYPKWPQSTVAQQKSAIEILTRYNILDEHLRVRQDLPKSYVYVNDNGIDTIVDKVEYKFNSFYDHELSEHPSPEYENFVKFLFGDNDSKKPLDNVLKMQEQCTYNEFVTIHNLSMRLKKDWKPVITQMDNWKELNKKNKSIQKTCCNWMNR